MKYLTSHDFKSDLFEFFNNEEEYNKFVEKVNTDLNSLNNTSKKKYIQHIKDLKSKNNYSNLDYINALKQLLKELETHSDLNAEGYTTSAHKDSRRNQEFKFRGKPNTISLQDIKQLDTDKLNQESISLCNLLIEERRNPDTKEFKTLLQDEYIFNHIVQNNDFFEDYTARLDSSLLVEKNGKTFLINTESETNGIYGSNLQNYNQLLKYQSAKNQGLVDEVVLKFQGHLSKEFLDYINPVDMKDNTEISDISIIYDIPLPSGKLFSFVLKSGVDSKENIEKLIHDINDTKYERQDMVIINRIFDAKLTGQLNDILLSNQNNYLSSDLSEYRNYLNNQVSEVHDKLFKIGLENLDKITSFNTEINDELLYKMIDDYQLSLKSTEATRNTREVYLLENKDEYHTIIDKMKSMIKQIETTSPKGNDLENLFKLSLEHIMLDAIQSYKGSIDSNRKGRNYKRQDENGEERFITPENLKSHIHDIKVEDEIIINLFDAKTNRVIIQKIEDMDKFNHQIDLHHKESIKEIKATLEKLPDDQKKIIQKALAEEENTSRTLKKEKGQKTGLIYKRDDLSQEEKDILREQLTKEQEQAKREAVEKLIDIYKNTIPNGSKIITNIQNIQLLNQKKYIYAVSVNENNKPEVYAYLEGFDPTLFGRPTHSELAEGRPVITAGELLVEKENRKFLNINDFQKYMHSEEKNEEYILTEMNNGSGHYRPNAKSLEHGLKHIQELGINPKTVRNSLERRFTIHSNPYLFAEAKARPKQKDETVEEIQSIIEETKYPKKKVSNKGYKLY